MRRLGLLALAAGALLSCAAGATPAPSESARPGQAPPQAAAPRAAAPPADTPSPARPPSSSPPARPYFAHGRLEAVRNAQGAPAGVRVLSVLPNGRLARMGLRGGDLMLRINGVSLTDAATFDEVVAIAERLLLGRDKVTVKITRDGETFSLAEMGPVRVGPPEPKAPDAAAPAPPPQP